MCACNRAEPRKSRPTADVAIIRNSSPPSTPVNPLPTSTSFTIQSMDPDRLRIEQLKRETIRRTFGR